MRKRNTLYDLGNGYFIRYQKIHTDIVAADIYQSTPQGPYKYGIIGRLLAYYYEFDKEELDPTFDNHWRISIRVYDKKYLTQDLFDLILDECRNNTYARAPFQAQMELARFESDIQKTEGRVGKD